MTILTNSSRIKPETKTNDITQNVLDLYDQLQQKAQPGFAKIIAPTLEKALSQQDNQSNNSLILLLKARDKIQQTQRRSLQYQEQPQSEANIIDLEQNNYIDEYIEALYCLLGATSKTVSSKPKYDLLNSVNCDGETPLLIALNNVSTSDINKTRHEKALDMILSCQNLDIAHSIHSLADKNSLNKNMLEKLVELYKERETCTHQNFQNRAQSIEKLNQEALSLSHNLNIVDFGRDKEIVAKLHRSSDLSKQAAYQSHTLSSDITKYQETPRTYEYLAALTYIMRGCYDNCNMLLQSRDFTNNINRDDQYKLMKYLIEEYAEKKASPLLENIESLTESALKNNIDIKNPENFHQHFILDNKEQSQSLTYNISQQEPEILARLCLYRYNGWEERLQILLESDISHQNNSAESNLNIVDFDEKTTSSNGLNLNTLNLRTSKTEEVRKVIEELNTPSQSTQRPTASHGRKNNHNLL